MKSVYASIMLKLQKEAEAVGLHILEGRCKSMEEYREQVAKRKTTLDHMATVKAEFGKQQNED